MSTSTDTSSTHLSLEAVETAVALMARTGFCWSPSLSPNGQRIAFIANLSGLPQVWTVDADGGWPALVTALDAFTSDTGGPIFISGLLAHFKQVLKRAELPQIRFHDLRHTAATLMLADGVPLVTVAKVLGHSSPSITGSIYAHALDESKSECAA